MTAATILMTVFAPEDRQEEDVQKAFGVEDRYHGELPHQREC